jgi:hypothetical protein
MIIENNILDTESSLIRKYKQLLWDNRNEFIMIDLGRDIPIFKWFISDNSTWESKTVMYKTESLLNKIAAAHKQIPDDSVKEMLTDAAKRMRNISKGGVISNAGYEFIIDKAMELKDVTEVIPNATIRYLKNPHFIWGKLVFLYSILYLLNLSLLASLYILLISFRHILHSPLNPSLFSFALLNSLTSLTTLHFLHFFSILDYFIYTMS